jgi:hypothetical protein
MTSANALVLGDARWKLARPICGTLRSQAVFYALAFFQLDGFAVPALVVELVETQRRYPLRGR